MTYVDGFVLPVPTKNLATYRKLAKVGAKIWMKHGALQYRECIADHMDVPFGMPFPKLVKPKKGETIVFSYIVYKSRAHRDSVNAKVMKDPGLAEACNPKDMPFDCKRMCYGGFRVLVEGK